MRRILLFNPPNNIFELKEKINSKEDVILVDNEFVHAVDEKSKQWLDLLLDLEYALHEYKNSQCVVLFLTDENDKKQKLALQYLTEIAGGRTRLYIVWPSRIMTKTYLFLKDMLNRNIPYPIIEKLDELIEVKEACCELWVD